MIIFETLFGNASGAEMTFYYTALNTSWINLKMHVCV